MTATTFELHHADDPKRATIVANTDNLDAVLPELDTIEQQMGGMAGGSGGDDSRGGIIATISNALGLGDGDGGVEESQRAEATELVESYGEMLQQHLEETGRWEEIRSIAAGE